MKKNISVNLFGSLYNIDEDAYELLQQYEESVRNYFRRKGDDDEVAQDVERRVAELFEELRQQGIEAITIEHVRGIIRRIGKPGEMDEAGDEAQEEQNGGEAQEQQAGKDAENNGNVSKPEPRKLYRDPDDCMLGGVMAGLAHYFGGSPTALRVLMVLLAFFVASIPWLIVCYLIACVLIPKAVTPEDKLRMMGKPVNLVSLGEGVINGVSDGVKNVQQRGCLGQTLSFIALIFKITLFVCFGSIAIIVGIIFFFLLCVLLVFLAASISSFTIGDSAFLWVFNNDIPAELMTQFSTQFSNTSFWTLIVLMILVCGMPLYGIVHLYRRMRGRELPWSNWTCGAFWLLWLFAMGMVISIGYNIQKTVQEITTYTHTTSAPTTDMEPIDDADADIVAVSDSIY